MVRSPSACDARFLRAIIDFPRDLSCGNAALAPRRPNVHVWQRSLRLSAAAMAGTLSTQGKFSRGVQKLHGVGELSCCYLDGTTAAERL